MIELKIEDPKELAYWSILNAYFWRQSIHAINLIKSVISVSGIFENGFLKTKKYYESSKELQKFLRDRIGKSIDVYEREVMEVNSQGVTLIPYNDERYPQLLKLIPHPPLMLYHKGPLMDFSNCIAVVGRRKLSSYGHILARDISRKLVKEGYTIVSGLARGVDTEAHVGALHEGGKTIAVLPCNFNQIYPEENSNLLLDVLINGCALSMTPPHTELEKSRFVHRNRIISGISKAVIIAETDGVGGSARQIEFAFRQKKVVFILKPKGNAEAVIGFEKFVNEGAIPFNTPEDLILKIKNGSNFKTANQMKLD